MKLYMINKPVITKQIIASLLFLLVSLSARLYGQQDTQYTQYMYNTTVINPAYAGSRDYLSLTALYRSQWVGLEGAPTSQNIGIHAPVGYRGVGLGFSAVRDEIGPTEETNFDVDFSYTIDTSRDGRLSFGLKAGGNLLDVKFSELHKYTTDPILASDIDKKFSPNFGAGIYYHTDRFYAGLSVPRFLETSHFDRSSLATAKEKMNFYLITGYVWDINDDLKFKPTILAKAVKGAPLQLDFSANLMLDEKFILGAAYRWDAALSGMAGFNVSNNFLIGLAYDREITELGSASFNNGSFEIVLRYDFIPNRRRLKSPRFF